MRSDPNNLSETARYELNRFQWTRNCVLDLHARGIHYYSAEYLPTYLEPEIYASIIHRGLTPPMALPIWTDSETHDQIETFLNENYFRLANSGIQYLGNEINIQPAEAWDKAKVRICMCRMSPYKIVDGAAGSHLVSNFITDYTDNIFIDFSFFPETGDIAKFYEHEIPWLFGNTTKRPLRDFDIVIIVTSYQSERVHIPAAMVKSGLPLYHWERWDESLPYYEKCPIIMFAGIGCFEPSTPVLMGDGSTLPIVEVRAGDSVMSYNQEKNMFEAQIVTNTCTKITEQPLWELCFEDSRGNHIVICTEDHRFLTKNRGWVKANLINEEDEIISF